MALKSHQTCLVTNKQDPHLVKPSLQHFSSSQFWGSAQTAPESALRPLSWRRIKILWAADSLGGSKSRTVLKLFLFYFFSTKQVRPPCLYQCLKWHSTGFFFSISLCSPQRSKDFCQTCVQWCPFLLPSLFKHHHHSIMKLKGVLLWLNCLFSEANQFLQVLLHSFIHERRFQSYKELTLVIVFLWDAEPALRLSPCQWTQHAPSVRFLGLSVRLQQQCAAWRLQCNPRVWVQAGEAWKKLLRKKWNCFLPLSYLSLAFI